MLFGRAKGEAPRARFSDAGPEHSKEGGSAAIKGVVGFAIRSYAYPRDRVIGGALGIRYTHNYIGALELFDDSGRSGLGFFYALGEALPSESVLHEHFERTWMPRLLGRAPEGLIHAVPQVRGPGRSSAFALDEAVEVALWDLSAKRAGLPLYRYLGGERSTAPAYASGLCFHMTEQELDAFYTAAAQRGFKAAKVKVGHPDLHWELSRLAIVKGALGAGAILMVDANEAWTVKETLQRLDAYQAAGHEIHWVEDPIPRLDFAGMKLLREELRAVALNAGEYLTGVQKRMLVEADAADVVNIHNDLSESLRIAWLCESKGLKVGLGNTVMDVGAHLSAALPNATWVEYAFLNDARILAAPLPQSDGCFCLTEAAGHGLALDPGADPLRVRS